MLIIILTSILASLIFAPLGCISLWKRYIYLADGLAHASLLAGSISILAHIPLIYTGMLIAIIFAIIIFKLKYNKASSVAMIALISSFMLSLALILGHNSPSQFSITQLLFGDILSSSIWDVIVLCVILILVTSFILTFYKKIILLVLNRDIAFVSGVNIKVIELLFLMLLSLSVLFTTRIIGALLVTSILLIPAISARLIAKNPLQMIIISIIIALIINFIGLISSFYFDLPTSPLIIVSGTIIYFILYILCRGQNR
jgi:zinc transport system permease protein